MSGEGCSCKGDPVPSLWRILVVLVVACVLVMIVVSEANCLENADYITTSFEGDGQFWTSDATEVGGTITKSLLGGEGPVTVYKVTAWNDTAAVQEIEGTWTGTGTWMNRYEGKVSEDKTGVHRLEIRSLGQVTVSTTLSSDPSFLDSSQSVEATEAYLKNVIEVPGLDDPIDERTRTYFEGRNLSGLFEWHTFVPPAAGGDDWLPCFDCTPDFDIQPDWNEGALFGYGDETCTNCTAEDGVEEEEIVIS